MMDFLDSQAGLSIAAFLVSVVWTLVQGTKWYKEHVEAQYKNVVEAIQAGVVETYACYVEHIKASRGPDGKLTVEERQVARDMALRKAREILVPKAINLEKVMTPQEAAAWVERGVTALKKGRGAHA